MKLKSILFYYKLHSSSFFPRFTEEECDEMFHFANADDDGNFNYLEFTKTIKHGEQDD